VVQGAHRGGAQAVSASAQMLSASGGASAVRVACTPYYCAGLRPPQTSTRRHISLIRMQRHSSRRSCTAYVLRTHLSAREQQDAQRARVCLPEQPLQGVGLTPEVNGLAFRHWDFDGHERGELLPTMQISIAHVALRDGARDRKLDG
jgi:hypothetical protein